jgi:hypothetical protein
MSTAAVQLPPRVTRDKAIAALVAAFPNSPTSSAAYLGEKSAEYLAVRLDCLLEGFQGFGIGVKTRRQARFDSADEVAPVLTAYQRRALAVLQEEAR